MSVIEAAERHQELIDELIETVAAYNKDVDRVLLARAFRFAATAHEGQQRRSAENYRKMIVAMAQDVRVILIKLADRLHNMRTIEYLGKQKQIQKAKETLEVYAPLAHRLGINKLKWELEDLAFTTLHPRKYEEIKAMVSERRADREEHVREAAMVLKAELEKVDIPAEISGRAKHFYSIYDKMAKKGREFNETAEFGVAAHWLYKIGTKTAPADEEWLAWIRQLMDWQEDEADPREFMKAFRTDLFDEEVYVFTPKGEVKVLPAGSTPIDFAYAVHTDVGHRTVGAKINGRIVPLHYR